MKKAALFTFFLIIISVPAFSMGFGLYGTAGYGRVDMLKIVNHSSDYKVNYSAENFLYGGGFLLESGNESEGYHNRLSIGMEASKAFGGRYDYGRLIRVKIDNVFAFRVAGNEQVRFWLGPLIGLNILTGLTDTTRNEKWPDHRANNYIAILGANPAAFQAYGLYYIYLERVWKRTTGVFIPVGIATGINIRMGESAAFTLEVGFRCGFYYLRNGGLNYEGYARTGFIFGAI